MPENYAAHHASVIVNAPVHQVYALFTHFNDFPKFMSFVKEVTYRDEQNSHWVAEVAGRHEWDAVNEEWIPDRQIGWRSTSGLDNFGKVTFEPVGSNQTKVDVFINYKPPAGFLGEIGEKLGAGSRFEHVLQEDMTHFARMVEEAPAGALDPNSSNYLFHPGSAAAKGTTTSRQNETMYDDPNLRQRTAEARPMTDRDITGTTNEELATRDTDTGAVPLEGRDVIPPSQYPENPESPRP
ncbi:MAG: SRPBCC family protein [Chloroflexi bacterium]|nr:SRPBCC family protein [Chloroflexota bacterium]